MFSVSIHWGVLKLLYFVVVVVVKNYCILIYVICEFVLASICFYIGICCFFLLLRLQIYFCDSVVESDRDYCIT